MNSVLAKTFLSDSKRMQMICDAVLTGMEFRDFCNAFSITPSDRLNILEHKPEDRVLIALKIWYKSSPTVADLKARLQSWGHFALIAKLGLDQTFNLHAWTEPRVENKKNVQITQPSVGGNSQPDDETNCVICLERKREIAFLPCGHRCCCPTCSDSIQQCPMCRTLFTSKVKIFG